jgi:hypothetical protein
MMTALGYDEAALRKQYQRATIVWSVLALVLGICIGYTIGSPR